MTTAPDPFDTSADADAEPTHLVLENALGEYSLWPVFRQAPEGWTAVYGPQTYGRCVARLQEPPA
ncbi:MbtH family NRPS accessory protein [Streptomyces sp. NPDC048436]|uniref:MbtH family NRPS accessory protein n=1 Tax=Streptomyces sp. NPDC048436 TaxID=3365550 RepID=UPI00371EF942